MPKINFNTPYLDFTGEPVLQPKFNKSKGKFGDNGQFTFEPVRDENGDLVLETMNLRNIVAETLLQPYPGDESMDFSERAIRGKLARKIMNSSTANYRDKDIAMIKDLAGRSKATLVLAQLDLLINGEDEDYAIAPAETPAAVAA